MPVAIGFHPYFQLTDSGRADWTINVGANLQYLLQPNKIPTGETEPISAKFKGPGAAPLKDYDLNNVFGDLVRDRQGRAHFSVSGKHQRVTVEFGPNFKAAVVYFPAPKPPQAERKRSACHGPELREHAGKYKEVESIAPGGSWEESFWVMPSGF